MSIQGSNQCVEDRKLSVEIYTILVHENYNIYIYK